MWLSNSITHVGSFASHDANYGYDGDGDDGDGDGDGMVMVMVC